MTSKINFIVWGNIKKRRNILKISQEQLWEKTWLSRTWISQIETWDKSPTIKTLELIANALKINIKELFNNEK